MRNGAPSALSGILIAVCLTYRLFVLPQPARESRGGKSDDRFFTPCFSIINSARQKTIPDRRSFITSRKIYGKYLEKKKRILFVIRKSFVGRNLNYIFQSSGRREGELGERSPLVLQKYYIYIFHVTSSCWEQRSLYKSINRPFILRGGDERRWDAVLQNAGH